MSCCSNQRAAAMTPALRAAAAAARHDPPDALAAILRYVGREPLTLRGPFSGAVYQLNTARRVINVDARDVEAMMRTGLFTR